MELASGLGFDGQQISAFAVNQSGEELFIPLNELYKRGLPTCAKSVRRRIDTDFADWRVVDGQDYLRAFGFTKSHAADINHEFFEVMDGNSTYVVPALALMRAIFRPTKHLLPAMFRPHALDRLCRLEVSDGGVSVLVEAKWSKGAQGSKCADTQPLFNWMLLYSSAFTMAGSVHDAALGGGVGLTLPKAKLRIVLRGFQAGKALFVSDATLMAISVHEDPHFETAELPPKTVLFNRDTTKGNWGIAGSLTKHFAVPLHKTGETATTDQEWEQIETIILDSRIRNTKPFVLPQRPILDSILAKFATGKSWRQGDFSVGNWVNASQAFRKWERAGTFDNILRVLRQSRNAP